MAHHHHSSAPRCPASTFHADAFALENFDSDVADAGIEPDGENWRLWIETAQGDMRSLSYPSREAAEFARNLLS